MAEDLAQHPASYRDPCGFVFTQAGIFYRAVQQEGKRDYDMLMQSNLYQKLIERQLMIAHEEVSGEVVRSQAYKILKPQQFSFWTYPYEWSFSQLKDAALLTLKLIKLGLEHGMMLKDANAYNIQFVQGRPMLIDSLSFEAYEEGKPWQAFSQFCQHFLYPLLVFQKSPELSPAILMAYPDGLSAQLTASLLPWKSRLNLNNQLYVYLAATLSKKQGDKQASYKISKQKILQNVAQLRGYIQKLNPRRPEAGWSNYYDETILSDAYLDNKKAVVDELLSTIKPTRIIDAGCNTGAFTMIAAKHAQEVISFDFDAASIDGLYGALARQEIPNIQTLVADIINPTPSLGWANAERSSLKDRLKGDVVLALALVHHLAIGKNVPFGFISSFFAEITNEWLLIEFVPKSDPKVQLLLQNRKDIFQHYTASYFEEAFQRHFSIEQSITLAHSSRTMYLLKKI
jgi:SAM-dependent methyltransferase